MLRMCCVENFSKADHIPYEVYTEGCRLFDEAELAVQYDDVLTLRVRQARAALDVSILTLYDSILYMAQKRGTVFPVARETAALRHALTVYETQKQAEAYCREHPDSEFPIWNGDEPLLRYQTRYVAPPLPDEFIGTEALQVPLADYVMQRATSKGIVYDRNPEAGNGFSARQHLDYSPDYIYDRCIMRHRDEEGPHFTMTLHHNRKIMERIFTLEDVKPDEYAVYHLFDVDDLSELSDSELTLILRSVIPHISGFANVIGEGKVSIYAWKNLLSHCTAETLIRRMQYGSTDCSLFRVNKGKQEQRTVSKKRPHQLQS